MSVRSPLATAYQALLTEGRLESNRGQARLVEVLGWLQHRLVATTQTQRTSFLPGLASLSTLASAPASTSSYPWQNGQQQHPQDDADQSHKSSSSNHDLSKNNGIYVYGGVGTGKSRITDLFAATLPNTIRHRRAHFFEFMTDTHLRLHRARSTTIGSMQYSGDPLIQIGREISQESPVLCLDEFQVSDIADAMILKRLFGSFWAAGGIVVSTSNRHPTDLYKNGLNRGLFLPFIDDLQRRCMVYEMEGTHDYRMDRNRYLRQRQQQQQQKLQDLQEQQNEHQQKEVDIFITDAAEFDALLAKDLGGAKLQSTEISVIMNRKFYVEAALPSVEAVGNSDSKSIDDESIAGSHVDASIKINPNVATGNGIDINVKVTHTNNDGINKQLKATNRLIIRTTLQELCEAYLGAADYQALCKKSQKIYMTGIYRFFGSQDNSKDSNSNMTANINLDTIRRFITLVDIAYENGTQIICQSTHPIQDIFPSLLVTVSDASGSAAATDKTDKTIHVLNQGGSSSSTMSTYYSVANTADRVEWSATGLKTASLAEGGAGETDVRFAVARAVSRLFEMRFW